MGRPFSTAVLDEAPQTSSPSEPVLSSRAVRPMGKIQLLFKVTELCVIIKNHSRTYVIHSLLWYIGEEETFDAE